MRGAGGATILTSMTMAFASLRRMLAMLAATVALAPGARADAVSQTDHVKAQLVAETNGVKPGGTVSVALRLDIIDHWHTYWTYPGDSGEATAIDWTLPAGVTAGPLQFPAPERIEIGPLVNYGYEHTILHLTDIAIPATVAAGQSIPLKADVTYLVCADVCVPEEASLTLDLPVVAAPPPSDPAVKAEFDAARAALPVPSPWPASYHVEGNAISLTLNAPDLAKAGLKSVILFPSEGGYIKNAARQAVTMDDGVVTVSTETGRRFSTPEKAAKVSDIPVIFAVAGSDGKAQAFMVAATPGAAPSASGESLSVWVALGAAFLGGLILNLMPCVFPVLSMKALSLAGKGGDLRGARIGGLAYTAGVVASFIALAAVLIALRQAGEAVGWGFQLQSPLVVSILALLFFAIGLNLMGVFEFGGGLQNLGAGVPRTEGPFGSFLTGILAAVVAAPCTAPFMAGAVGTAISQPIPIALIIFAALGLGMAFPYLLLACWPALVRRLPKPGVWMERLKQVLAFPMFASGVWLLWVLTLQAGANAVALVLGAMVVAAFGLWLWGLSQRGQGGWLAKAASLVAAIATITAVVVVPQTAITAAAAAGGETSGPVSEPYTPARLETLLAAGKPVFVNLTAAWCVTCLWNEESTLSTAAVSEAFKTAGVTYLKGDWTNADPEITKLLERYSRAGVPLYLYFRPGSHEPEILPQLLTEAIVVDAINAAPPAT